MSVIAKCAVTSQKHLIVPGLQKLLEDVIPVQTCMKKYVSSEIFQQWGAYLKMIILWHQ